MMRLLKWIGLALAGLLVLLLVIGFAVHEARPQGEPGLAAEQLADKMLAAVNDQAWNATDRVAWNFADRHRYNWNKAQDSVTVTWGKYRVDLHTKTVTGRAFKNGAQITGNEADDLIADAWSYFCNDSFWLSAPFKIRDPGTQRSVVTLEDGSEGLLVEYSTGGVTPGDAYLWQLNEQGMPVAYQMWVDIIPVGGIRATWQGYETLSSGAQVSTVHEIGPYILRLTELNSTAH